MPASEVAVTAPTLAATSCPAPVALLSTVVPELVSQLSLQLLMHLDYAHFGLLSLGDGSVGWGKKMSVV